ncbi:AAA family ATPase [Candidatus Phytoplasma pruni]|uniref:ATP-binding protein n=1 Tax=Candidatus Phytoplasma pruni TaxID=479893 RepID=A0A851HAJ0_9MOLU|nr:AAA family ATPase [Candidatus Phytoplasma pruni]NWN45972.1 ATP-binding protein [Candidatus Phytoplasma pruni]
MPPKKNHPSKSKLPIFFMTLFTLLFIGGLGFGLYYYYQQSQSSPTPTITPPPISETKPDKPAPETPSKPEVEEPPQETKPIKIETYDPKNYTTKEFLDAVRTKTQELTFNPLKYIKEMKLYTTEDLKQEKRFHDLIGMEQEKAVLEDFLQTIRTPSELTDLGFKPLTGLMLYGPPGTGKTSLARALAKETGYNYLEIDGTIFQKFNTKEGIEMVDALFFWAHQFAPIIVCIDESEIPMHNLTTADSQATKNIVTKFKNNLTGLKFDKDKAIFFIGTTNHLEDIDSAILSRFDYKVEVNPLDKKNRQHFLETYVKNVVKTQSTEHGTVYRYTDEAFQHLRKINEKLEAYPSLQNPRQLISLLKKAAISAIKRYYPNPEEVKKITPQDLDAAFEAYKIEAERQNEQDRKNASSSKKTD